MIKTWAQETYFSPPKRPDRPWGPPSVPDSGYRTVFLPGVERSGRVVDHSLPSRDEVKNEWSYTSPPPIQLQELDRDNFLHTALRCAQAQQSKEFRKHRLTQIKGKAIPLQAWTGAEGSRRLRLPDFKTIDT